MATKSALITAVNGYLTAVITYLTHRSSMLEIINAIFQTTTNQTLATGSNVFWYNLRYKKIGNIIYIDGTIQSKYSTTQNSVTLVTIPDSLFYAKTGQTTTVRCNSDMGDCTILFSTSTISLVSPIAANQIVYVNAHYQTND